MLVIFDSGVLKLSSSLTETDCVQGHIVLSGFLATATNRLHISHIFCRHDACLFDFLFLKKGDGEVNGSRESGDW